jgi:hypothetical protein
MSELTLQWIMVLKLLTLVLYASLYAFGGMRGKWKRRWIAPFVLTVGICLLSLWSGTFSWWFVGYFPLLAISLSLGYGASEFWLKMFKRSYVGLALACAALPIAIGTGAWGLLALHALFCVATSVALGVFNITSSARAEETTIAMVSGLLPLAMF